MDWSTSLPAAVPADEHDQVRGSLVVSGDPIDAVIDDLETGFFDAAR